MNLSRIADVAERLPGIVYVIAFASIAIVGGTTAVIKSAEHRGAARAKHEITLAARTDSLKAIERYAKELALADSIASAERNAAIIDVQAATVRRTKPSHRVVVTSDTSVTVVTQAGADTTVAVAPQVITALRDRDAQITADSVALKADSTELATKAAKAVNDSARITLTTRVADSSPDESADTGMSLGAKAKVTVAVVGTVVLVVEAVRLAGRLFHH